MPEMEKAHVLGGAFLARAHVGCDREPIPHRDDSRAYLPGVIVDGGRNRVDAGRPAPRAFTGTGTVGYRHCAVQRVLLHSEVPELLGEPSSKQSW